MLNVNLVPIDLCELYQNLPHFFYTSLQKKNSQVLVHLHTLRVGSVRGTISLNENLISQLNKTKHINLVYHQ